MTLTSTLKPTTGEIFKTLPGYFSRYFKKAGVNGERLAASVTSCNCPLDPSDSKSFQALRASSNASISSVAESIPSRERSISNTGFTLDEISSLTKATEVSTKDPKTNDEPKPSKAVKEPKTYAQIVASCLGKVGPVKNPYQILGQAVSNGSTAEKRRQEEAASDLQGILSQLIRPKTLKDLARQRLLPEPPKWDNYFGYKRPQERTDIAQCDPGVIAVARDYLELLPTFEKWTNVDKFGFRAKTTKMFKSNFQHIEQELIWFEEDYLTMIGNVTADWTDVVQKQAATSHFLDQCQEANLEMEYQLRRVRHSRAVFKLPYKRINHLAWFQHIWNHNKSDLEGAIAMCENLRALRRETDDGMFALSQRTRMLHHHAREAKRIQRLFELMHRRYGTSSHLMERYVFPMWHHFDKIRRSFLKTDLFSVSFDFCAVLQQAHIDNCRGHHLMNQLEARRAETERLVQVLDEELNEELHPWHP